ncbi:MAG: TetR/AcrR family transcriptional regulator [Pseudomonadota bacterium]
MSKPHQQQARNTATKGRHPRSRAPKTGQIERTKNTVLDATTELLGEIAYGRLTIDLVVERSGIARSTIYRYWKTLAELVSDAFDRALGPNPDVPDVGNVRDQLIALFSQLPRILDRSIWGTVLPSLIAANSSDGEFAGRLHRIADQRREDIRLLLRRAVKRGELPEAVDIEWMIDLLSGLFYHRRLITGASIHEDNIVERTVDTVLAGIERTYRR